VQVYMYVNNIERYSKNAIVLTFDDEMMYLIINLYFKSTYCIKFYLFVYNCNLNSKEMSYGRIGMQRKVRKQTERLGLVLKHQRNRI
jgi:hypothetical protein